MTDWNIDTDDAPPIPDEPVILPEQIEQADAFREGRTTGDAEIGQLPPGPPNV